MERDHRRFARIPETAEARRVQGFLDNGARGTRTPDLLGAIQAPVSPECAGLQGLLGGFVSLAADQNSLSLRPFGSRLGQPRAPLAHSVRSAAPRVGGARQVAGALGELRPEEVAILSRSTRSSATLQRPS